MRLSFVLHKIEQELSRYAPLYRVLREESHAFDAFDSFDELADLVDALGVSSPLTVEQRNALIWACIELHHAAVHPLWQALLVHAFAPMLFDLRGRVRGDGGEVDQQILTSFLEAVWQLGCRPDPRRIAMHLRQATKRALFRLLRREARQCDEDAKVALLPAPSLSEERASARVLTARLADIDPRLSELLQTLREHGQLRAYVRARQPDASLDAQDRLYRRLQRRRHRLSSKLRRTGLPCAA
jgi:hypothetical protein